VSVRARYVVLVATLISCSSDSITSARGPDGERLATVLSATSVASGDSITVSLEISNPTSRTVHFAYVASNTIYPQFTQSGKVLGPYNPTVDLSSTVDSIGLSPSASYTLGPVWVHASTGGDGFVAIGGPITVGPGAYKVRACIYAPESATQAALLCGNNVSLSVTP
jgi:hypothetical protein